LDLMVASIAIGLVSLLPMPVAGSVKLRSGKEWVVVFFINHTNAKTGSHAQDALIEWVRQQY